MVGKSFSRVVVECPQCGPRGIARLRGTCVKHGGLECLEGIKMLVRGQHLGDDKGALESWGHSVEEGEVLGLAGLPDDLEGAR